MTFLRSRLPSAFLRETMVVVCTIKYGTGAWRGATLTVPLYGLLNDSSPDTAVAYTSGNASGLTPAHISLGELAIGVVPRLDGTTNSGLIMTAAIRRLPTRRQRERWCQQGYIPRSLPIGARWSVCHHSVVC